MMVKHKLLLLAPVVAWSFLVSIGCGALWFGGGAAAGVGSYAFIKGELKVNEEVSLDRAYEAAQKAMKDLEFSITSKGKDAFYGEVIARRATGKKVIVKLSKQSKTLTEIKIRVGTFGDESMSRQVHRTMKKYF